MKVSENTVQQSAIVINKSIGGLFERRDYYLRLTSVQFSSVNIISGMKRMAGVDDVTG